MSLQDLLNSYSQEISAQVAHNEAVQQDNADRKATTLEETFQHAKDAIEGIGGEIAGVGAGYHLGRKLYKKYKEKYGNKKAENPAENNNNDMQEEPEEEREGESGQGGSSEGGEGSATGNNPTPTEEASNGTSANDVSNPEADESAEQAEAPTDEDGNIETPQQSAPTADASSEPTFNLGSEESQQTRSALADALQNAPEVGEVEGNIGVGDRFGDDILQRARASAQQAVQGAVEQLNQPEPVVRDESDAQNVHDDTIRSATQEQPQTDSQPRPPDAEADVGDTENAIDGAVNDAREGLSSARSLTGTMSDGLNAVKDAVGNGAKQLASKVGGLLPEGADLGGLVTAEGVLDLLGPIGEIGGAIVGLVGLFEGLFHKPKPPSITKDNSELQTNAVGIDPTALAQKQQVVGAVI